MFDYLTTRQAAARLGISIRRVQALITAGRLKATAFNGTYAIRPADLAAVKVRKPGRPRKRT
jgi:excisionase family DNA binding protein